MTVSFPVSFRETQSSVNKTDTLLDIVSCVRHPPWQAVCPAPSTSFVLRHFRELVRKSALERALLLLVLRSAYHSAEKNFSSGEFTLGRALASGLTQFKKRRHKHE
jgi:hypothetical protein